MNGYYKRIRELLLKNGWQSNRQKGSHETWTNPNYRPIVVSTSCKSKALANKILKDAGIDHKF